MDENVYIKKVKNPRADANIFSILTFSWILRIFCVGYRRELKVTDLYTPLEEHTSSILGVKIAKAWEKECMAYQYRLEQIAKSGSQKKIKEPSLLRVLIRCFGFKILLYGIIMAIMEIVSRVVPPLFLGQMLLYFNTMNVDKFYVYYCAVGIILSTVVNVFVGHLYIMGTMHMGMKVHVACGSLIYRKTLKLTKTALGETTIGQMVNLLFNDVNRFNESITYLHYLWLGPLLTIIIMYIMYYMIGISSIIGIVSLLLFIPLQVWLGQKSSKLRLRTAIRTDERVRITNEIISGIQAIKMYTWENLFSALVEKARKREVNIIQWMLHIKGMTTSFTIFTTRISLFITVLAYVLLDYKLTAEKVFMIIAYYNSLCTIMNLFFPLGESIVSIKRLQNFLMYDELTFPEIENDRKETNIKKNAKKSNTQSTKKDNQYVVKENNKEDAKEDLTKQNKDEYIIVNQLNYFEHSIFIENGSAKWLDYELENNLQNINLKVRSGELIAVVGQIGAGKSSLLNVILKELRLQKGSIQINGKIAYASQEPWLFAGSVKQNILFGRKMDHIRYDCVIKICQLKKDFSLLPHGDKTIISERGINLSGGQRARINLARAVYADVDIYLMDDPLSAVDAYVGKYIFEKCIDKYLRNKTRILVTHQLQYLHNVDRIIVLKNGTIQAEGTYDDLDSMGVDFGQLLENQKANEKFSRPSSVSISRSNSLTSSITSLCSFTTSDTSRQEPNEVPETRTVGNVSRKLYKNYLRAGANWCVIFIVAMLFIVTQLTASSSDFSLTQWINKEEYYMNNQKDNVVMENSRSSLIHMECIYIYGGLIVLTIVITLIRTWIFFCTSVRASMRLHERMFRSISRATMQFFNNNTSGCILNRFSTDISAVDEILPTSAIDCIQIGLSLLGIIILVSIANVWLLIPTVLICIVFYYLRIFYLTTSRSVKHLENIARSPIFTHLSATLQGLPTIRAFKVEAILAKEFDNHQDIHSSAWYIFIATTRAFGLWLDAFCMLYITLVTLSFLVMNSRGLIDSGYVGLAITQSLNLTRWIQWGIRQSAEMENQMTSVERILEYSKVNSEPPLESAPGKKPKSEWPQEGKINFKNVFLCYAPLEPSVLKNLNFLIFPREKIGIVGRTGAGKSSLIQALFRLADVNGLIEIDEVDTSQIGLHDLRSKISIIPQEPFLFSGSLRQNLDPFDSYTDDILWQALEDVELKEIGLEATINEDGSNLSVGQRQLVCLARAIVRNNPILVLDEATANVDPRTDELIQTTIRKKFEMCTVLTIAHRLNIVMDSDRILVMDAGNVVEFDHPYMLLQKETGYLKRMVLDTGTAMAETLTGIARDCYKNRAFTAL